MEYFSETFAAMSMAYAAAHDGDPVESGPTYGAEVEVEPLTTAEQALLQLSHADFEAYVRETAASLVAMTAAEKYIPEETDTGNTYSVFNGAMEEGDIWYSTEKDSLNFYRNGDALGVPGLFPIMNDEGELDQEMLNEAVAARIANPEGGYAHVFEKDARLMRIIEEYVKGKEASGSVQTREHYRELIYSVKVEAVKGMAAERARMMGADERYEELAQVIGVDAARALMMGASGALE
jgi:hypothetical protein